MYQQPQISFVHLKPQNVTLIFKTVAKQKFTTITYWFKILAKKVKCIASKCSKKCKYRGPGVDINITDQHVIV